MKPKSKSQTLLSITQAKAKMYEYAVPEDYHIPIPRDPARLFTLAIGLLGDLSAQINRENSDPATIRKLKFQLSFSAKFFDSYFQAKLDSEIDPYVWLLGSSSYYLSDLPGSAILLARKLENSPLELEGSGLDQLLLWILLGDYKNIPDDDDRPYSRFIQSIENAYHEYFSYGTGDENLIQSIKELRSFVYANGTPRQLLFSDIIGAITRNKYQNSTWYCLPKYSGLSIDDWSGVLRKDSFTIKELWPAQQLLGEFGVYRGKSAIVQMPTSAGKTMAIEIIIRSAFLANRTSMSVIVAPFRALCHEIRENLLKAFRSEKIFINELSDVLQPDYSVELFLDRKQVLVVTPEKLNYVLRHTPELGQQIGLIVYDEGHQFDNGTRGITYELLLTSLKKELPEGVQSVLISAVISNGDKIGYWLNGEDCQIITGSSLIPTYRSVAFSSWTSGRGRLYFVNPQDIEFQEYFVPRLIEEYELEPRNTERVSRRFPNRTSGPQIALLLGLKVARNGSVAIFCGTKNTVNSMCKVIVDAFARNLPLHTPYEYSDRVEVNKLISLHEANLGPNAEASQSARLGIFAHHNNIPHGLRLSIEYALKEGTAKFVICTSTLAQGVNLPLRYLIVAGTRQGDQEIKVRDFQNLIGRTGRAKFHTEGSTIFADPRVYDTHTFIRENEPWRKIKRLLNPSLSEPCDSTLLSIFEPIEVLHSHEYIDSSELIKIYPQGRQAVTNYVHKYAENSHFENDVKADLINQTTMKLDVISSIESFLMSHSDIDSPGLAEETVINLAEGTLAYYLAEDIQKEQLVELFKLLAQNIVNYLPEPERRIAFGKSLFGLYDSIRISTWVLANIDLLTSSKDEFILLNNLWPILIENIRNSTFNKCSQPDIMKTIALDWINGNSYFDLLTIIEESGAKYLAGSQHRNFQINQIVEVCDNGFSFEGTLVIGAITDFLELSQKERFGTLLEQLHTLQKRLKYGLTSPTAIVLYEMGFSDRVISMALQPIFEDLPPTRESIVNALRGRQEQIFEVLDKYPSYFSEIYRNHTA